MSKGGGGVFYDRNAFFDRFEEVMKTALQRAGDAAEKLMFENIMSIPKSGYNATGRPEWHMDVIAALKNKFEWHLNGVMTQLVGMVDVPDNSFLMIKAKLLEYGTGSEGDRQGGGSGNLIAHRPGVAGLNDDLTGYNAPFDAPYYELPVEYNQIPQHWFKDADVLIDEIYNDEITAAWAKLDPWKFIKNK